MKIDFPGDSTQANSVLYHDSNSLVNIRQASDPQSALETVAKQFEAMFLQLVLRQMRSSSDVMADKDSPFSSKQQGVFRDMYDGQMSIEMAKKQSSGIADMLVKQLGPTVGSTESNVVSLASVSARISQKRRLADGNHLSLVNSTTNIDASVKQGQTEVKVSNAFSQPLIRKLER